MSGLRLSGLLLGIATLLVLFLWLRRGRLRRADFLLGSLFSGGLFLVSLAPGSITWLRDLLALQEAPFARVFALLLASNIVLLWGLFYLKGTLNLRDERFDRLIRTLGAEAFTREYGDRPPIKPIQVVIPAYQEAESIGTVLRRIPRQVSGYEVGILVVVDGIGDPTAEVVQGLEVPLVYNVINRGGGAALRLGYDLAFRYGAQVIVTMDADGQHQPEEVEGLVAPILEQQADFVIGSRLLGRSDWDSPFRRVGLYVFNSVIYLLTGLKMTDCSSGFRAFRADKLREIVLKEDQYHTSELLIEAARKKVRIVEVPVTITSRLAGVSKKGANWRYGFNFARAIVKTWLR